MKRINMSPCRQKYDFPKYPLVYNGQGMPHRMFDCAGYDDCLDVASNGNWLGWQCPRVCKSYCEKTAAQILAEDRAIRKAMSK